MMSPIVDNSQSAHRSSGTAVHWQAALYSSYIADTLQRLADDPNPDVQSIGQKMNECMRCASAKRCADCPFNRGLGARR
ncbi:MAG: hypothetical protein FJX55_21165 [Alphaproteobacteria bacterium]|nr:hypothetical protein [Alphaproteobacteria bacterium]